MEQKMSIILFLVVFFLEAACLTLEAFNKTIKHVVCLLKSGDLLLLMSRNESFCHVYQEKNWFLFIT
jgi:hypothetical protein